MPAQPIVLYPNPILRQPAAEAAAGDPFTESVLQDLWDTLDSHVGVGIAAPQIGQSIRIICVDATRARRPVANHGRLALLNPVIVASEGEAAFREGCLSIPDLVARVRRANRISISALLPDGSPVTIQSEGFEAVILQHEVDHINGVLFIDRVHNARDLKIREKNSG